MLKKKFGKLLKNARKEKNISQLELSHRVGVCKRSIEHWEHGEKDISLENADKLLKALGIEMKIGGGD